MFEPGTNEIVVGPRRGGRSSRGSTSAATAALGREPVDRGRHLRATAAACPSRRSGATPRVLQPAYRRGNTFQSVHARLAIPGGVHRVQGRPDRRSAARTSRWSARASTTPSSPQALTQLVSSLGGDHRRADGARRRLRRAQHDVHRGRRAHPRDRHPAGARLRQRRRSSSRSSPSRWCSPLLGGADRRRLACFAFNGYPDLDPELAELQPGRLRLRGDSARCWCAGIVIALAIGLVGGLFPAIRAARLPVATALREL